MTRQAGILSPKLLYVPFTVCKCLSFQESLAPCLWTPREKDAWITGSMPYRNPQMGPSFFLFFIMTAIRKSSGVAGPCPSLAHATGRGLGGEEGPVVLLGGQLGDPAPIIKLSAAL